MMRSQNTYEYLISRSLRIFPGLWVMLIATTLLLAAFSDLPIHAYFSDPATLQYLLGNGLLYWPKYYLPGVFGENALPAINGSLWTLRFEFTCYLIVLLMFLFGAFRKESAFRSICIAMLVFYFGLIFVFLLRGDLDDLLHDGSDVAKLHRLWFAFFTGVVVGRYIAVFRPGFWLVVSSFLVCILLYGTPLFATALIVSIALACFWFAFLQAGWLAPFRKMHDYSYGIYIYGFPVQQTVAQLAPEMSSLGNAFVSLLLTVPCAALSWYLVEKPALSLRSRLVRSPASP